MGQSSEANGSYQFCRISGVPDNRQWCYSAKALQEELNQLLKGLTIQKVYISLDSYRSGSGDGQTYVNLSFAGGCSLLVFEKVAVAFVLHVDGMVEYSVFAPDRLRIEEISGFAPGGAYFMALQSCPMAQYAGKRVVEVEVRPADTWGYRREGFDEERAKQAADANDLPNGICLFLKNGAQLQLICDTFGGFHVRLE